MKKNQQIKRVKTLAWRIGTLVLLGLMILGSYYFKKLPWVNITSAELKVSSEMEFGRGDTIKPFQDLDLKGEKIELFVVFNDPLNTEFPKILYTDKIDQIEKLNIGGEAVVTGGDMATLENRIILKKDGQLIRSFSFVISENKPSGLQSQSYGWMEFTSADNFKSVIGKLEKVHRPYVSI